MSEELAIVCAMKVNQYRSICASWRRLPAIQIRTSVADTSSGYQSTWRRQLPLT